MKQGIPRVKMKIGREPECNVHRVAVPREAIGDEAELFVDTKGFRLIRNHPQPEMEIAAGEYGSDNLHLGVTQPGDGALRPDLPRWGNGLKLKRSDAEQYRIAI